MTDALDRLAREFAAGAVLIALAGARFKPGTAILVPTQVDDIAARVGLRATR